MIKKILIANRGEIAVRIIKTAKKMGIETVAIYSEADVNSLAVQMADEAYFVGPAPSAQSYLVIDKIIDIVKKTEACAVHPGYGFLSENYDFVSRLEKIGVKLIGPSKESIELMGDKITSKKIAQEAGVNTIPGFVGEIENVEKAKEIAASIGYPVMVKATAGGGGRGMRIVRSEAEIENAFTSAANEAKKSFGDERLFIEKFIEMPRHIEIQVLADQHGNVVCLGERECSIQRYNQKIIEEAPSPFLDDKMRKEMYAQSASLAKKVGYHSAGTIEYIADKNGNFYFLEMNTRLQVEHPVTELVTGIDLVESMIKVANNEKLEISQDEVKLNGWAMESRIYAEDPERGFLPSSGRINCYIEPEQCSNVRIDTGVYEGGEVSMFYDPMIAKLCSYGKNRDEAIEYMQKALSEYVINGVSNNISFLEAIFHSDRYKSGNLSTNYISEEYPDGYKKNKVQSSLTLNIICAAVILKIKDRERLAEINGKIIEVKNLISDRWAVSYRGKTKYVEVTTISEREYLIHIQGGEIKVETDWHFGSPLFKAKIDDIDVALKFFAYPGYFRFLCGGGEVKISVLTPRAAELNKYMPEKIEETDDNVVKAPISGKIISLKTVAGEEVKAGLDLFAIEAMKMENIIKSEREGKIAKINVKEGDTVQVDDVIIEYALK